MDKYNQQNTPPKDAATAQKPCADSAKPGVAPTQTTGQQHPASDAAPRDPAKQAGGQTEPAHESHPGYTPPKV